jgi:hypothetical protein
MRMTPEQVRIVGSVTCEDLNGITYLGKPRFMLDKQGVGSSVLDPGQDFCVKEV